MALKIQSSDIPHKTESGALRLNLQCDDAIIRGFDEVMNAARSYKSNAHIDGVLVQEMINEGHEMLLGISHDLVFGPVLAVGFGGTFAEIIKDISLRLPPVDKTTAYEMLLELRSFPLLEGVRGQPPADIDALTDCIVRLSWLATHHAGLIKELDINPLKVGYQGQGVRVVDATYRLGRGTQPTELKTKTANRWSSAPSDRLGTSEESGRGLDADRDQSGNG